jgi:hypothetical protein
MEADLFRCKVSTITLCPAKTAVYDVCALTCQASLFFQIADSYSLCQRSLLLCHKVPTLRRHEALWLYQFLEPWQVIIHCPGIDDQTPHAEVLSGAGLILNASRYSIANGKVQTLADLQGTTRTELHPWHIYIPDKFPLWLNMKCNSWRRQCRWQSNVTRSNRSWQRHN